MEVINYTIGEIGQRPWGSWIVLDIMPGTVLKKINVNSGCRISLQSHEHRAERWIIAAGCATVELDEKIIHMQTGEMITIPAKSKHRLSNEGLEPLCVIELQIGDKLDERDIIRYEDDYQRSLGIV